VEDKSIGITKLCASDASLLPVQITNNIVNRHGTGIHTSNVSCLNIHENEINLLTAQYQHHGIWLNRAPHNVVTNNNVNGNVQDWHCIGIRIYNSNDVHVGCNNIDKTEMAFFLDNDCDYSRFAKNILTRYNKGFTFLNSAKIGDQADVSGFTYNLQNEFQKNSQSLYEFVADLSIVGSNSTFYFKPATGNSTDIVNMQGALLDGLGNIIPASTGNTSPGNTNNGLPGTSPWQINTKLELFELPTTSLAGLGYNDCGNFIPDPNNIPNGFASGDMLTIEFTPFYENEHKWLFKQNILRNYKAFRTQIVHPLTANVQEFMDTINSSNIAQLDSVETLIGLHNYQAAFNMNSICNATCNYSNKLNQINQLLIPQWDSLSQNLQYVINDTTVINAIMSIANLCLVEYGDAVLKSRIFIHNHWDPFIEFMDPCDQIFSGQEERSLIINSDEINETDYILYPNPSSDEVNVITSAQNEISFIITDIQGRQISSGQFNGSIQLNTLEWPSGIYFMILTDVLNYQSNTIRFIIVH